MAPPGYGDLGKSARDIFDKGHNAGNVKLDFKTKTSNGVEFTSKGSSSNDSGKVTGSLETKYKCKDYGLTFEEKWSTDNVLGMDISIEDQLIEGLKLSFISSFAPQTGKKSGKIKTGYKMEHLNLGCDVDFDFAGPTVNGSGVLGYNNWLGGYQMAFDSSKSKLTKNNFAFGYCGKDFALHANINDGQEYCGSIYNKCSKDLQCGVNFSWSAGTSTSKFGVGAKYILDKDASLNMKVNNNSQIGMGYTQQIRDGVKLTLSVLLDGKSLNQGGHKLGLGLDLEA